MPCSSYYSKGSSLLPDLLGIGISALVSSTRCTIGLVTMCVLRVCRTSFGLFFVGHFIIQGTEAVAPPGEQPPLVPSGLGVSCTPEQIYTNKGDFCTNCCTILVVCNNYNNSQIFCFVTVITLKELFCYQICWESVIAAPVSSTSCTIGLVDLLHLVEMRGLRAFFIS